MSASYDSDFDSELSTAESVAQTFLHTIVVVDDEATYAEAGRPEDDLLLNDPSFDDRGGNEIKSSTELSHALDAKRLTDSFARKGLVSSVLKPGGEEHFAEEVRASARRADIVVLDWTVDKKKGVLAKSLVRGIIDDDGAQPNRLRLIAIYTAEPDLDDIAGEVAVLLQVPQHQHTITKGSTRICVVSKTYVPAEDLPSTLIAEFAVMIDGLLPFVAVSGITALRDNTYRLLGRFHNGLDPAYLSHRLLSANPMEAEQHIEAALSLEMQALIEDNRVGNKAGVVAIREWLDARIGNLPYLVDVLKPKSAADKKNLTEFVTDILREGIERSNRHGISGKKSERAQLTRAFTNDAASAPGSDQEFAALLSLRHSYSLQPRLWLGSVIKSVDETDSSYWLCIQPRCDSTNLKTATRFAFLRLMEMTKSISDDYLCVINDDSKLLTLVVSKKIDDLRCIDFEPGDTGDVLTDGVGRLFTSSDSGATFQWLCELKEEQGQRAVGTFSGWISRVGVAESGWVRQHQRK